MSAPAYSREWALALSDALVELGVTHSIGVGVADKHMPREQYSVDIRPALTYSATRISALQRLADSFECGVAFMAGAFTFTQDDRTPSSGSRPRPRTSETGH
jgi:hypothetical protein